MGGGGGKHIAKNTNNLTPPTQKCSSDEMVQSVPGLPQPGCVKAPGLLKTLPFSLEVEHPWELPARGVGAGGSPDSWGFREVRRAQVSLTGEVSWVSSSGRSC